MFTQLRPAIVFTLFFTLLTGIAYPLALTGVAGTALPEQARGSLVERAGKIIGSRLIGQDFERADYFHGRPSAAKYDASSSTGSNYAPSATALRDLIRARAAAYGGAEVPADLVTASGSGLDPDISPAAALVQVKRVAAARGLSEAALSQLIAEHTQGPELGMLGARRVNVLALNLALDAIEP